VASLTHRRCAIPRVRLHVLMLLGMTANGHTLHTYMYIIVNNCIYFFLFVKRLELLDMCAIEIEDIIILLCLGDGGWGVNIHNLRFITF
jgi:hypothetical protein